MPQDITDLYKEFPGWTFGTVWATVNTGPDVRRIWGQKGGFLVSAWTAEELRFEIARIPGMTDALDTLPTEAPERE